MKELAQDDITSLERLRNTGSKKHLDSKDPGEYLFSGLSGVQNARSLSPTGTMRRMGSCTAIRTTGRSLGSSAMVVLC